MSQIKSLYVYSSQQNTRVPLLSVATVRNILETGRIRRREHFRTISILCFPAPGVLASEVLGPIESKLKDLQNRLPPGYQLQIAGEKAKQVDGFTNLAVVLLISLVGIYLALLVQFKNAVKPLLVFAAAPYGAMGALIALAIMGTPFGFMAFLGVASLIGVIVSHVIVLFDFIEEMHEKGEPLERALPDAGIERIRPVMITVGATILASLSACTRRWPAVETSLLCPNRRSRRRNFYHLAVGSGLLRHFRARSKVDQMGNDRRPTAGPRSRANDNLTKTQQVNKRILILGQT